MFNLIDNLIASKADTPWVASARGLKKLIPLLQDELDFSKLNFWLSLINLVLQVKGKITEIRIWGETDGRYRIYVSLSKAKRTGQAMMIILLSLTKLFL